MFNTPHKIVSIQKFKVWLDISFMYAMQIFTQCMGEQWLSGRVLDSRPRGPGFEPHRRHCVVSLSKTHLSLLSTGSTEEDRPRHN